MRVRLRISEYPVSLDSDAIRKMAGRHGAVVEFLAIDSFRKIPIREAKCCDPVRAFRNCAMCPLLRDGRIYPCSYTGLADILARRFGTAPAVASTDSINIYDASDGYEIFRFLSRPVEWCRHCDVDATEHFAWRPSKRLLEEWT